MASTFNEDNSKNTEKGKKHSFSDIRKRMSAAYQKKQREKKIHKLMSDDNHWKGLT